MLLDAVACGGFAAGQEISTDSGGRRVPSSNGPTSRAAAAIAGSVTFTATVERIFIFLCFH